jgi:hypothetical protein
MAKTTALNFTQTVNGKGLTFVPADSALTLKTLYTASTNDAVIKTLSACSDDSVARVIDVLINDGTTDFMVGSVSVPITAGTTGAVAVADFLGGTVMTHLSYDSTGKRVLLLKGGYVLKVRNQTVITAAKTVTVWASIEEY